MAGRAERGMSAPPEVVFNTATDPSRNSAWLPEPLRAAGPEIVDGPGCARWSGADGWTATLRVHEGDTGGTRAELDLDSSGPDDGLTDLAGESLGNLARETADNLTAG